MNERPPASGNELFLIEESQEERLSRLDQIRLRVAEGSYEVSARAVADAVVAFFDRAEPPAIAQNPVSSDDTC